MPKVSKIKTPASKSTKVPKPKVEEPGRRFVCSRCGRDYYAQKRNFPASQSPIWACNNAFIPVCMICIDALYGKYTHELGTEEAAARRLCMMFDFYWSPTMFASVKQTVERAAYLNTGSSTMRIYFGKTNLLSIRGKTFDDTLYEEAAQAVSAMQEHVDACEADVSVEVQRRVQEEIRRRIAAGECPEDVNVAAEYPESDAVGKIIGEMREPDPQDVEFWGAGYTVEEYDLLNKKYEQWVDQTGDVDDEGNVPIGTSTLLRQICTLDLQIGRNINAGKPVETSMRQLNDLIGSVNARPGQSKDDGSGGSFDSLPFGVGIRIFENNKPIPKPLPQLEDVDGIVRYISIWFIFV